MRESRASLLLSPHRERLTLSPYELAVGLRYTRARRGSGRNSFISFIALTSMAGIALGVAALIVVLSVMNGFQEELRNRILASHRTSRCAACPVLADRRRRREVGARKSAREGGCALRPGPGDALGGRSEPRRADPRHRSGAGSGRRGHRQAHARGLARRVEARRVRHRARRRDRAGAGRAPGRYGRRDHAAGNGDPGRHAAAPQELSTSSAYSRSACTSSTAALR